MQDQWTAFFCVNGDMQDQWTAFYESEASLKPVGCKLNFRVNEPLTE